MSDGAVPVPVQLRAIEEDTLRLSGTIAGQPFSLDAPDADGRWLVRMNVPSGTPISASLTWTRADGLVLAVLETELPAVEQNGSLRIGAAGYATADFDDDGDSVPNVDELRCDTDPYDRDSRPGDDCADSPPPPEGDGALERLSADGRFGRFVEAIERSGRAALLSAERSTVFAPSDAAFAASLTSAQYEELASDVVALGLLVDRHVLPGVAFDADRLNDLVGNTAFIANDASTIEIVAVATGGLDYVVAANPVRGSVRAGARIGDVDIVSVGGTIVHRVESLVSIDHGVAIDFSVPADYSANCFAAANRAELPREAGAYTYTFNAGGTSVIWQELTLTERASIAVTHTSGTPTDSGAALYDLSGGTPVLVAADDDAGTGDRELAFVLRSTVLEPGRYCLAYGHYRGEAVPVPAEGWEGAVDIAVRPTAGTS